jgi:SAM-dependent methyltransferase
MEQPGYEYKGMIAAYWDLLRGDTSKWDDRFFYRELIRESGQPALDVGCGTGRLLLDYMSEGMELDGVDNSPEMLALCREKAEKLGLRPNLYLQTMETLDLPRRYRTIIVPSSSFQLVLEPDDAREAMRRFFDHLEPGGTLAMPFMILWVEPEDEEAAEWEITGERVTARDWKVTGERARPEDGSVVRRWSKGWYDLANRLEHTEDRYEVVRDGEVIASEYHMRSPATRWYTQEEALELYREAGFAEIRIVKGFKLPQEPATKEDTIFTVLGIKAQE